MYHFTDIEHEVLQILCDHNFNWNYSYIPLSSTTISSDLGLSLYKTRKALKSLKEKGLVKSDRFCYLSEDSNHIMNGYKITEQAKETEEYKVANEKERELIEYLKQHDIL